MLAAQSSSELGAAVVDATVELLATPVFFAVAVAVAVPDSTCVAAKNTPSATNALALREAAILRAWAAAWRRLGRRVGAGSMGSLSRGLRTAPGSTPPLGPAWESPSDFPGLRVPAFASPRDWGKMETRRDHGGTNEEHQMGSIATTFLAAPGRPAFGYGPGGGRHWGAIVVGGLILAGLVALAIWAVLRLSNAWTARPVAVPAGVADPAFEALRVRYARGEVDRGTYLSTAADLGFDLRPTEAPPAAPPPA